MRKLTLVHLGIDSSQCFVSLKNSCQWDFRYGFTWLIGSSISQVTKIPEKNYKREYIYFSLSSVKEEIWVNLGFHWMLIKPIVEYSSLIFDIGHVSTKLTPAPIIVKANAWKHKTHLAEILDIHDYTEFSQLFGFLVCLSVEFAFGLYRDA